MFKAIYHLFFGKPFEFYSRYTFKETYQRLYDLSQRDKREIPIWRRPKYYLLVEFEHLDSNPYFFHADREEGRNLLIIAEGLVEQNTTGVKVSGVVRLGKFTILFPLIFQVIWATLLIHLTGGYQSTLLKLYVFPSVVFTLVFTIAKYGQFKLHRTIYNTLVTEKE